MPIRSPEPGAVTPAWPRRILMTSDTVGGVWTYSLELARALAAHGIETDLATMGAPLSPRQQQDAAAVPFLRVHESEYRLEWMDDPWASIAEAGRWLLDLENELEPDLVHLNHYAHGARNWRTPVVIAAHGCARSWWRAVYDEDAPAGWERYAHEVRAGLAAARGVIVPSLATLAVLEADYGPFGPTAIVPYGIDPAGFAPDEKREVVLTAGRLWDPARNVAALDRAAAQLEWPVWVAGEAHGADGRSTSLNHAIALGHLDRRSLAREMARAAIFAQPALYEPFGTCALEAGLSGCALVLGDEPVQREVWKNAAVFVAPRDSDALRATLQRLIADPKLRIAYARRALTRAREYSASAMAQATLAVYRRCREPVAYLPHEVGVAPRV